MKKKIKNILISNIYSWKNKGDAAIVIAMLEDVQVQYPEAKITLSSLDKNDVSMYGDFEHRSSTPLHVYKGNESKITMLFKIVFFLFKVKLFGIIFKLGISPYFLFSKLFSEKIKEYNKYDLVIGCGGGYLLTRSNGGIFQLLVFAYDFYFAKIFNKPYILYNQSIGPFKSKLHFSLMKPFLENAKKLIIREEISFNRLKEYNLSNIILSSDIAFNLGIKNTSILDNHSFSADNLNFGLTVRNWLPFDEQMIYEKEIATFIQVLLSQEQNAFFYFIPQVIVKDMSDDDLVTSNKIFELISKEYQSRVIVLDMNLGPKELKYIISQMNYFIGTRMHSNIFALSSLIKTIAIAYEPKTTGIMKMLKLSSYVINMEDVDSDKLYKLYLKLKSDKEYLKILSDRINYVKIQSINDLQSFIEN